MIASDTELNEFMTAYLPAEDITSDCSSQLNKEQQCKNKCKLKSKAQ